MASLETIHTDLSQTSTTLAILGGFILLYGLVSYVVSQRLYLSEPLLAVLLGIAVGPYGLAWIDPRSWGTEAQRDEVGFQLTRIVVGIQVVFTGIELPKAYLWRERRSLAVLLLGVMSVGWLVTAGLVCALVPDITFKQALAIAAAVTPTDPILSNSVTKGRYAQKYVPSPVRQLLLAESGANDGLGLPLVYLALYVLVLPKGAERGEVGAMVGRWVYSIVIYQVGLAILFGAVLGYVARKMLRWAEERGHVDKTLFFAYGLGLALFTLGTTGMVGCDDILACFVAGNSFTWDDWFRLRTHGHDFQELVDAVLNLGVFLYIGTVVAWEEYGKAELGWGRMVALATAVLLLRRPPWVLAGKWWVAPLRGWRDAMFAAWFGPVGVGAVFYTQVVKRWIREGEVGGGGGGGQGAEKVKTFITPVVLLCVLASVVVHGITVPLVKAGPAIGRRCKRALEQRNGHGGHLPDAGAGGGEGGGVEIELEVGMRKERA
ncbi:hypothetical protein ACQY0O_004983 [Thecaphora frezii]